MRKCPHCGQRVILRRVFWRQDPYRCPHCRHFSEIPYSSRILWTGVPLVLAPLGMHVLIRAYHGVALVFLLAVYVLILLFAMSFLTACFARFRPVVDEKYEH